MNVQDKINKLSDDIVKLTTTSALDIIELMKSGQKDKVDKIVAFGEQLKEKFGEVFEEFVLDQDNQRKLTEYADTLFQMREINNKEDYQKVVFALYISNSSKEVSTVLGNVLDWSMNFNQLVSEYVDYVFLRDYFSDHPELVAFYEKEISLFGEERDTRRQIVEKVFHTFKQRFSFA